MPGEERLRRRLGELARVRGSSAALPSPAGPVRARPELEGLLPGCEVATPLGSLHVHEVVRGHGDPGYARLLDLFADLRERLALVPERALGPDFAGLKQHGLDGVLFLDLETGGLAGNPVFLAGLLAIAPDGLHLRQLLARTYLEERALIAEVAAALAARPLVVTYNGKSFDLPMLADRAAWHGLPWSAPPCHLDLLHHARRAYRGRAPDCRLVTLEWAVCRRRRLGDVAGRDIPGLFHRFARIGDPSAVVPVLHHNALDLVTLAELLAHLVPHPPGPRFVPDEELLAPGA